MSAKLRIEFIGMAFALAVGQVGLEVGEFYSHGLKIEQHPYVFFQLLLGTYIIASSWVGWQNSKSSGSLEDIANTFSKGFLLLLIDLFLVVCYFIVVKSVEKPYEENRQSDVSANSELFWSRIIFITYMVWDFFSKLIHFDSTQFSLRFQWREYITRGYQALLCFLLLFIVRYTFFDNHTPATAITIDIYIIAVFVLFRGLKEKMDQSGRHHLIKYIKWIGYRIVPAAIICLYYLNYFFQFTNLTELTVPSK